MCIVFVAGSRIHALSVSLVLGKGKNGSDSSRSTLFFPRADGSMLVGSDVIPAPKRADPATCTNKPLPTSTCKMQVNVRSALTAWAKADLGNQTRCSVRRKTQDQPGRIKRKTQKGKERGK